MFLAVAEAQGGAEGLLPVLKALRFKQGLTLKVVARAQAAACLQAEGFPVEERSALSEERLDGKTELLLTGTHWLSDFERSFLQAARRQGIPSISILDSWIHYRERFPDNLLPDRIGVMDDLALEEMVQEGFPRDCLRVVGHPGFDELARWAGRPEAEKERMDLRNRWGLKSDEKLLLFFSQPSPGIEQAWNWLLESLQKLGHRKPYRLVLKLHPRENERDWSEKIRSASIPVQLAREENADRLLKIADGVLGLTSQTLVKGYLLGRPVISIRPAEESGDGLMLSRAGYLDRCAGLAPLTDQLARALEDNLPAGARKKLPGSLTDGQSTQRVLRQLEELLEKSYAH